jgi:hypothetical protein
MEVEPDLADIDLATFRSLLDKVSYLPGTHSTLRLRAGIVTPAEYRAVQAILSEPVGVSEGVLYELIGEVLIAFDSPGRRMELARAVLSLRDEGHIPPDVAATAVLELDRKKSDILACSVLALLLRLEREPWTPSVTPGAAIR